MSDAFSFRWFLHLMGDGLAGAYLAAFTPDHIYVGATDNSTKRNKNGTDFSKGYNNRVKNAFKKHGVTDFLFIKSRFFYFIIEGYHLKIFEEMVKNGDKTIANQKFSFGQGGDTCTGRRQTPEHRAKNSEANSGDKNPMYGKNHSPEARAKMSGDKHPNYDATVRTFQHKDGRKFFQNFAFESLKQVFKTRGRILKESTCTQNELRKKYSLNQGNLSSVVSGRWPSCDGWRVVNDIGGK